MPSDKRRFTDYVPVSPEEAGSIRDKDGNELKGGDTGFLEELGRQSGFTVVNLDENPELADDDED